MNYPLSLSFKLLALASQIYVRDRDGAIVGYVKQKLLKLKEDINVFADEGQTRLLYNVKADRVLDFSARYNFTDAAGNRLGAIKRQGMRSLWKANYEIFDAFDRPVLRINEENGWVKVFDALVGEVPVVGMFSGYFLNPAYVVSRGDGGEAVARLQKQPALFESKFTLEQKANFAEAEAPLILLGALTMTLLERGRG